MADFNFPSTPLLYDTHTEGDTIYEWDGVAWNIIGPDFIRTEVEVNTTRTLSPGIPASVINIGTPTNVLLNFNIPQGIQGEQGWPGPAGGPPGPEGPPGPPGPSGRTTSASLQDVLSRIEVLEAKVRTLESGTYS